MGHVYVFYYPISKKTKLKDFHFDYRHYLFLPFISFLLFTAVTIKKKEIISDVTVFDKIIVLWSLIFLTNYVNYMKLHILSTTSNLRYQVIISILDREHTFIPL